jgi:tetratricopeptide (TPR) repeat protein
MGDVMRLALSIRRTVVGLPIAISLVAVGPLVSVGQVMNSRTAPNGYSTAPSPSAGIRGGAVAEPQRESLFGDQRFRWQMPFARKKTQEKPAPAYQRPPVGRSMPKSALQGRPIASGQLNRAPISARAPLSRNPAMATGNQPRIDAQQRIPAAGVPQRIATRPSVAPAPVAMPHATQAAMAASPKPAAESPAVRLLAQAHELSSTAKTENDYSRIIAACQQAQMSQPNPATSRYANELAAWALNRRGQLKAEAGRDTDALSDFDASVKADSKRWRPVHNRGVLLAQSGEFEPAFDDFTKTIQVNPQFAKAYSNRAALYIVAGHTTPAIQDFRRAIELDPDLSVAHRGLGRACHLEGKLEFAVRHYDEAIRLSPNDAYAIASRADVLTDLGRYAEAAREYERAIEVDPQSSHAQGGSAWLLATCPDDAVRDSELAIERARTALELTGPEDASSLDTLAAAQANSGDFAAATQTIQQAIRLTEDDEKQAYQQRLTLYEQEKPYRHAVLTNVIQASHQD